jgi:glycosyltransferase involved in cell wall biosynthesis
VSQSVLPVSGQRVALLFSPNLHGHRIIYCRVLAEVLVSLGFNVVVAGSSHDVGFADDALLADLERRPGVTIHDLDDGASNPHSLSTLADVIRRSNADVTILTEADDLIPALAERARPRAQALPGRVVGLFIRSTNYVHGVRPPALARAKSRLVDLRDGRTDDVRFHERLLARRGVVDATLVLDERFVLGHADTHGWLPDIFREFGAAPGAAGEALEWRDRLQSFLRGHGEQPAIVYAGMSSWRRGYDRLLDLALDEGGCFLHCGVRDKQYEADDGRLRSLRAQLAGNQALLETDGPYLSADTAAQFLTAARCIVLPYRRFDGSSGSMLQAVAAGRPVLVPDRGLTGWRVRSFGLGMVYREDDEADFRRRFHDLYQRGPDGYQAALRAYIGLFGRRQVDAAVSRAVLGHGPGAALPRRWPAGRDADSGVESVAR